MLLSTSLFEYFTVQEVASLLKVKKGYIYDLVNQGKLKAIRVSERRIRIPGSSLKEFTESEMDNNMVYNRVVQPPRRGRKPNGTAKK